MGSSHLFLGKEETGTIQQSVLGKEETGTIQQSVLGKEETGTIQQRKKLIQYSKEKNSKNHVNRG